MVMNHQNIALIINGFVANLNEGLYISVFCYVVLLLAKLSWQYCKIGFYKETKQISYDALWCRHIIIHFNKLFDNIADWEIDKKTYMYFQMIVFSFRKVHSSHNSRRFPVYSVTYSFVWNFSELKIMI